MVNPKSTLPLPLYKRIPRERRPLSMRLMEDSMGQPMEHIMAILYYQERSLIRLAKRMGLSFYTVRSWSRNLGLFTCQKCTHKKGKFVNEIYVCRGCRRNLCKACYDKEPLEHLLSALEGL